VLALAVCAFTAAGHDSPVAIAEWAAGCSRQALLILGGRADPLARTVRAPSVRTFSRVLGKIDADALNHALYGFLEEMPAAAPGTLPEVTRHEREQRRAAKAAQKPAVPGLLGQGPPGTARPSAAPSAPTAAGCTCYRSSTWATAARWRRGKWTPKTKRDPRTPDIGRCFMQGLGGI